MALLVAVDIGGTFTDFVVLKVETGEILNFKVPSTPPDFANGFADGFQRLTGEGWASPGEVTSVFHGTTVGTNALIERRLPKLGLLTTRGMRDVLEIRRHWRGPGDLYNFFLTVPEPLVPRDRRKEVTERLAADGSVITPLVESDVRRALMELRDAGVESLAVCFLHAYANGAQEQRVRQILDEIWPGTPVCPGDRRTPHAAFQAEPAGSSITRTGRGDHVSRRPMGPWPADPHDDLPPSGARVW